MISVIIPVFNGAEWLAQAIESALNQTVRVKNVVVVDDGSTDDSLKVAQKYRAEISIQSQANKGLASARNSGVMVSFFSFLPQSDYLLFLDADDKLLPNAVEKITEAIKQTQADIVAPSFKEFGLSDREVILMENPTLKDFKTGNRIGYCAAIRRSALLEVGGYSPKMVEGYEDLHLWINLLSRGKELVTIPEVLWMYRTKKESMYTKITPEIHKKLIAQINKDFPQCQLTF